MHGEGFSCSSFWQLEVKGKPQASFPWDAAALVSRPELMNSLCQQGFAPTLPVPPVHPCMQQCRKTLPFGRVTQWLRASGCHPFWSRIPQLCTEMVLFTVRDLLGEKGPRGAQKQIKIFLNREKKLKKAEVCGEEKSSFPAALRENRNIHLVHPRKARWRGRALSVLPPAVTQLRQAAPRARAALGGAFSLQHHQPLEIFDQELSCSWNVFLSKQVSGSLDK